MKGDRDQLGNQLEEGPALLKRTLFEINSEYIQNNKHLQKIKVIFHGSMDPFLIVIISGHISTATPVPTGYVPS